jgi:hypothetical protein
LLGFAPTGYASGTGLVEIGGALTTIEARGTAVGFSDTKVKEGVGPVGVGKRVITKLPLVLTRPVLGMGMALLPDGVTEEATVAEEATAEEEPGVAWRLK